MRHNARESDDIANITYVSFQNHLLLSLSWKESYTHDTTKTFSFPRGFRVVN